MHSVTFSALQISKNNQFSIIVLINVPIIFTHHQLEAGSEHAMDIITHKHLLNM